MTFKEFQKKVKLSYRFGMRRTDGASRRYSDPEMNIGCEIHTPYNEEEMRWGKGKAYYYMEDSETTYSTLRELYDAHFKHI